MWEISHIAFFHTAGRLNDLSFHSMQMYSVQRTTYEAHIALLIVPTRHERNP